MNTSNQSVQVAAIIGIVVIVLALIAATVYAPNSGINNLLTLIGGVVTVLLGLAKLQSVENKATAAVAAATTATNQSIANGVKSDALAEKLEAVHQDVNGINQAALTNQAIVSEAKGEARGDAAGFERGVNQREASDVRPAV